MFDALKLDKQVSGMIMIDDMNILEQFQQPEASDKLLQCKDKAQQDGFISYEMKFYFNMFAQIVHKDGRITQGNRFDLKGFLKDFDGSDIKFSFETSCEIDSARFTDSNVD